MATIRIKCEVEGLPAGMWIEGSDEITVKRRAKWWDVKTVAEERESALAFISDWHVFNVDLTEAPKPTTIEAFDNLHVRVETWIFTAINQLIQEASSLPLASKPKSPA